MFGVTYYNETLKKYIAIFGTLFNDIKLIRADDNAVKTEYLVPINFAPTQKFLARLQQDYKLDAPRIILPRISYEIINIDYDGERKLAPSVFSNVSSTLLEKTIVQSPTPYNIDFQLNIMVKHLEDGYKIVEQILPVFKPTFNVSAKILENSNEFIDIPITLNSINFEDGYEGPVETPRPIIFTLVFTLKGYFYGPTTNKKVIKFVTANLYDGLTANTPIEYLTVQPGSTAANTATIDVNLSRDWTLIDETDNWDYIVTVNTNQGS